MVRIVLIKGFQVLINSWSNDVDKACDSGTTLYHGLFHLPLDHFATNIFKCEKFCFSIQFSLKCVSTSPIDKKSAWVQVMACRRTSNKPLPEPMFTQQAIIQTITSRYIQIYDNTDF